MLGVADARLLEETVDAVAAGDARRALTALEECVEQGRDAGSFASDLEVRARELLVVQTLGEVPDGAVAHAGGRRRAAGAGRARGSRDGGAPAGAAGRRRWRRVRAGADPRTRLELALVKAARPEVDGSMRALLARIERLERERARAGAPPWPVEQGRLPAPCWSRRRAGPGQPALRQPPARRGGSRRARCAAASSDVAPARPAAAPSPPPTIARVGRPRRPPRAARTSSRCARCGRRSSSWSQRERSAAARVIAEARAGRGRRRGPDARLSRQRATFLKKKAEDPDNRAVVDRGAARGSPAGAGGSHTSCARSSTRREAARARRTLRGGVGGALHGGVRRRGDLPSVSAARTPPERREQVTARVDDAQAAADAEHAADDAAGAEDAAGHGGSPRRSSRTRSSRPRRVAAW